jgi:hypothetical protein
MTIINQAVTENYLICTKLAIFPSRKNPKVFEGFAHCLPIVGKQRLIFLCAWAFFVVK